MPIDMSESPNQYLPMIVVFMYTEVFSSSPLSKAPTPVMEVEDHDTYILWCHL